MTAAQAKQIYHAHNPYATQKDRHPLDGKTVSEWVQEARAGWPKVPVPRDPFKAAQKVTAAYSDVTFEER